ncbi:trypsin-7 isoform X1 [Spodoptera frugiperda]|uniref:Trypsin-7 isoform X1 n=1 Tax=Spodoptera frugiperda TaxID=7108 RepID=A0A9R0DUG0_SPOFR|nr:trypsin-7 isoform X1 [Spodoptera frugiperda]
MLVKTGLFLLLVTVLQVSARYAGVQPDFIENVIKHEEEAVLSGSRIVSGWEAEPGQHPHHAALRMVDPTGSVSACGGSIASREWVITAAHCTAGRVTIVVRGGVVSLTNPEYISESTEYYNHPLYDNSKPTVVQHHDIGLVKLQSPVTYSFRLQRIRIQPRADAYRNYEGALVYASGHGRTWTGGATTEVLRWVYLTAISNQACGSTFTSGIIIETSICARFYNVTSQSTCQGDSGGPLVHVGSDGVPTLIGVTSFVAGGDFGCHSGLPAGFIRPGPYLNWFEQVTGIDFENLVEVEPTTPTTPAPSPTTPEDRPTIPDEGPTVRPTTPEDRPTIPDDGPTDRPTIPDDGPTVVPTIPDDGPTVVPTIPDDGPTDRPTIPDDVPTVRPTSSIPDFTTSWPVRPTTEDYQTVATTPNDDEGSGGDDGDDCSDSDEDDELSELLKRLEVKVKVKVRFDKYKHKQETDKVVEVKKHH